MPTPLDLLNEPEFTDGRLTEAINIPPATTGRLAQINLFRDTPIATTYAKIGIREQTITIIPSRERGGPTNKNMGAGRAELIVGIPHFPLDDAIGPSDVQNLMAYGEAAVFQTLAGVWNEKLADIRAKHDATSAHLDWGAINGLILDAENRQVLDTYAQFGLTQTSLAFALGTSTTNIAAKNRALKSTISRELQGAAATGVRIFASSEWFDAYVSHPNVADAYKYYAASVNPSRDDITDSFTHAGVTVERVDEEFSVRLDDGTFQTRRAIPANEGIAVPLGTPYFRRYLAPPDTIFDVNAAPQVGRRVYVSTHDLPHGKGREIHTESNLLPICLRPQAMVRVTM